MIVTYFSQFGCHVLVKKLKGMQFGEWPLELPTPEAHLKNALGAGRHQRLIVLIHDDLNHFACGQLRVRKAARLGHGFECREIGSLEWPHLHLTGSAPEALRKGTGPGPDSPTPAAPVPLP